MNAIDAAEVERRAAHQRLQATLSLIKARIAPRAVAQRAVDGAKARLVDGGVRAADAVSERPLLFAGMAAAAIAAFGGWRWTRRPATPDRHETQVTTDELTGAMTGFGRAPSVTQTLKERPR